MGILCCWFYDIDVVIFGFDLYLLVFVGWFYGVVVFCDYMSIYGGFGEVLWVVLINIIFGFMLLGMFDVGGEYVF